ncbi:Tetracycline resistance protein, class B [Metalysinibacillus saudimassiliensis]|uniref:Tetracycline resistance protein, class B n=1 Tax=Metalysinibacillus saudimassiliensis TaxID=1461583 RepID=A0A078MFC6_9BACL|nr:Tetracycline resistance protein, class B [Metalysinibacillus saudimassiliensis]
MSKNKKITLTILLTNLFIAFLGIGLVIPVLPTIMNELNISGKVVGYMVATFAIVQLIVSPFSGRWVDKIGRKPMIVTGLFIFGVSEFLFGLGKSVEILFISRALGGLSAAFIMPAVTAFIADITTMATRPKALGYMSAAINTGFIIGPGFGGFLAEIGTRVPFYTAGVLGAVAALLSLLFLKEPERSTEEVVARNGDEKERKGLQRIFHPLYFIAFVVIFVSTFGLSTFESLFSLFVDHKFGFTPKDIAIVITGGAIIGAIAQVVLLDPIVKKIGEINLIRIALLVSALLAFAMTLVSSYFMILAVTFTIFIGFDLIRPAVTSYLSNVAGNEQGFVGGMNSMFTSLGNIFGPVLGGFLFDINLDYPYYFATITLFIGLGIAIFWKKPQL